MKNTVLPVVRPQFLRICPQSAADDERAKAAIDKAVQFLKDNYKSGAMGPTAATVGGPTGLDDGRVALCGIALLEATLRRTTPPS